jgi:transposase InsO family protein
VVISDQGREFVNAVQAELFALTGTKHCLTSAYHPQSNGLTERFNQTLQTALQKVVNDEQNNWDDHISAILFAYRTAKQKATKLSPFELMYCR